MPAATPVLEGIRARRLTPVPGVPPLEQGTIAPLIVKTSAGSFQLGLFEGLAPKAKTHVSLLVAEGFYSGKPITVTPDRLVFGAPESGEPKPQAVKEPNLARPERGAVFFDGVSQLAVLLTDQGAPEGWTCVGQAVIPGDVLARFQPGEPLVVEEVVAPAI